MSEPYGSPLAILYLSDLLMGAAYSDSELDGKEVETVKQILAEVTGEELSATIEQRIDTFDPSTFSVDGTVRLPLTGWEKHRIDFPPQLSRLGTGFELSDQAGRP